MVFAFISEFIKVRKSHLGSYLSISVDIHKSVRFCSKNSPELFRRDSSKPPSLSAEGAEKQRRVRGACFSYSAAVCVSHSHANCVGLHF